MSTDKYINNYYDKFGKEIKAGMVLEHDTGETDYVYECLNEEEGLKDLGFNASNENHVNFDELNRKIYPLYQFNLKEWAIKYDS